MRPNTKHHPQEKSVLFKRYLSLDWFIHIAGFSISAAWIILSAARHSTAQTYCENQFYPTTSTANSAASLSGSSDTVCNIFSWVDVGIMAGLFVVVLLMQVGANLHPPAADRLSDRANFLRRCTCSSWHHHTAKPNKSTEYATTASTSPRTLSRQASQWNLDPIPTIVTGKKTAN